MTAGSDRDRHVLPDTDPAAVYTARCAEFAARRDFYDRRWGLVANVRLALLLLAVALGGVGIWRGLAPLQWTGAAFLLAFIAAVVYHRRLGAFRRRFDALWMLNDEGLRRLRRDWATLPLRTPRKAPAEHPLAADLDLLGHASLQHLLGTPRSPAGLAMLQQWILEPAPPKVAEQRQPAVAELAPLLDWRDQLALRSASLAALEGRYQGFVAWAGGPEWLSQRAALLGAARLLPLLIAAGFALQWAGLVRYPVWVVGVLVNIVITRFWGSQVDAVVDRVAERQGVFGAYATVFEHIETSAFAAACLRDVQAGLGAAGQPASRHMRRLQRIMILADLRMWLLYAVIQWLTLWNVHVLWLLERWQRAAGRHARGWLDALGQTESLAALAALRFDHPSWSFPVFADRPRPEIVATGLAHPLLHPDAAVPNDVSVGPPGTFLLVTGSNMSGKSTLLRAIGVNVVLAQMGAPVFARSFRLPPVRLATSMRVQDSLEQGVSYFMAELRRLKQVVAAAGQPDPAGAVLVFLLDEILHGTNTAERQIAARAVIGRLLDLKATGAVSTHDLGLVDTPALDGKHTDVYFTETFSRGDGRPSIAFDYCLRPGIAKTTNALKLMEIVGLPIAELEASGGTPRRAD